MMSDRFKIFVLIAVLFCIDVQARAPVTAEVVEAQSRLASLEQLRVTGELVDLVPPTATRAREYERFSLAFDRPSQRLRFSFSRFGGVGAARVDIEASGTLSCLNVTFAQRMWPVMIQAKSQTCGNLDALLSMLGEGTQTLPAPSAILNGMVRDTMLPHMVREPGSIVTVVHNREHVEIVQAFTGLPEVSWRYWLSPAGVRLEKIEGTDSTHRVRMRYTWSESPLTDANFAYTPDKEVEGLALAYKDPKNAQAILDSLARGGSKAASLQLALTDVAIGVMYNGWPKGDHEFTERAWTELESLDKQGYSTGLPRARWLARAAAAELPDRFKAMTLQQRTQAASGFFWQAARECNAEALHDLPRALSMGGDVLDADPSRIPDSDAIRKHCEEVTTPAELKAASAKLTDPWP